MCILEIALALLPCTLQQLGGNLEVVKALIAKGADVNAQSTRKGNTPLHNAVLHNKPHAVNALLDAYADNLIRNKEGKTPLRIRPSELQKAI